MTSYPHHCVTVVNKNVFHNETFVCSRFLTSIYTFCKKNNGPWIFIRIILPRRNIIPKHVLTTKPWRKTVAGFVEMRFTIPVVCQISFLLIPDEEIDHRFLFTLWNCFWCWSKSQTYCSEWTVCKTDVILILVTSRIQVWRLVFCDIRRAQVWRCLLGWLHAFYIPRLGTKCYAQFMFVLPIFQAPKWWIQMECSTNLITLYNSFLNSDCFALCPQIEVFVEISHNRKNQFENYHCYTERKVFVLHQPTLYTCQKKTCTCVNEKERSCLCNKNNAIRIHSNVRSNRVACVPGFHGTGQQQTVCADKRSTLCQRLKPGVKQPSVTLTQKKYKICVTSGVRRPPTCQVCVEGHLTFRTATISQSTADGRKIHGCIHLHSQIHQAFLFFLQAKNCDILRWGSSVCLHKLPNNRTLWCVHRIRRSKSRFVKCYDILFILWSVYIFCTSRRKCLKKKNVHKTALFRPPRHPPNLGFKIELGPFSERYIPQILKSCCFLSNFFHLFMQ